MDIRVIRDNDNFKSNGSFTVTTLSEFKKTKVDQFLSKIEKEIIKKYLITDFERNIPIRNISIITYRTLNFILY